MRSARLGAGVALSFVFIIIGCSQSPPRKTPSWEPATTSTSQGIQGGTVDGSQHPYAVGVCIGPSPNCSALCSGALILPNVVVTARHCVDQTDHVIDCTANPTFGARNTQMSITTNGVMDNSATWHAVKAVSVPTDNHVCGHDIALLILNDLVPGSEATPIIPGVQYPMTDSNRYPDYLVTAIGFGSAGPNPTPFTAGVRRYLASIPLLCIPGDVDIPCPPEVNENEFFTGDGTCEGDSGSSAYENNSVSLNKPLSFGVLSRGGDNAGDAGQPATLCKNGLYTRLDKFRDLVVQTADSASNNWTLYPKPVPDWTIYVPPPPDAGAPEASTTKAPLADGHACTANADCKSNVCADTGAGKACTEACDPSVMPATCPDGFFCQGSVCVQGSAPVAVPTATPLRTTTTTSGCSVMGPGRVSAPGAPLPTLGITAAGALFLAVRRRRPRRRAGRAG